MTLPNTIADQHVHQLMAPAHSDDSSGNVRGTRQSLRRRLKKGKFKKEGKVFCLPFLASIRPPNSPDPFWSRQLWEVLLDVWTQGVASWSSHRSDFWDVQCKKKDKEIKESGELDRSTPSLSRSFNFPWVVPGLQQGQDGIHMNTRNQGFQAEHCDQCYSLHGSIISMLLMIQRVFDDQIVCHLQ